VTILEETIPVPDRGGYMTIGLEKADLQGGGHLALRAGAAFTLAEADRAGRLVFCIYEKTGELQ